MTQRAKMETKDTQNYGNKSSRELEEEIGQTRDAISQDIRALGDKVSPAHLKAEAKVALTEAKDAAVEKAVEIKDAAVDTVAGVTTAAADKAVEIKDVVVDKAIEVKDVVVDKAIEVKDAAAEKVEEYKEIAAETYDEVSYQARRASRATWSYTKANAVPLALIGVGTGLLIANARRGPEDHPSRPAMRRPASYRSELAEPGNYSRSSRPAALRPRNFDSRTNAERAEREVWGDGESRRGNAPGAENGSQESRGRASQKVAELGSRVGERARGIYETAEERLQQAEHRLADSAVRGRDYAKERLVRARDATRDFAEQNPLPLALATVALGIGVGLLLPSTSRENKLLGPTRDKLGRLVDEAREAAYDVAEVAKETASETARAIS